MVVDGVTRGSFEITTPTAQQRKTNLRLESNRRVTKKVEHQDVQGGVDCDSASVWCSFETWSRVLIGLGLVLLFFRNISIALWSPEFQSYNHQNIADIDTESLWAAELDVALAMEEQMNLWPPASTCTRRRTASNEQYQPRPFLSHSEAREEIDQYYQEVKSLNKTLGFGGLGKRLLQRAIALNRTLLTYQIGGMDGVSNDPMYRIFVKDSIGSEATSSTNNIHSQSPPHKLQQTFLHWMPIVVEANGYNFPKLQQNYENLRVGTKKEPFQHDVPLLEIPCKIIEHWAISYGGESNGSDTCEFCRFNQNYLSSTDNYSAEKSSVTIPKHVNSSSTANIMGDEIPLLCRNQPDWVKTQIGTINCRHSQKVMGEVFDQCFIRERVNCGTTMDLLTRRVGNDQDQQQQQYQRDDDEDSTILASRIMILQIDTEGYESVVLPNLIQEFTASPNNNNYELPPVIHFESKILRKWWRKGKNNALERIYEMLKHRGYQIYPGRQDDLAVRVSATMDCDE